MADENREETQDTEVRDEQVADEVEGGGTDRPYDAREDRSSDRSDAASTTPAATPTPRPPSSAS